MTTITDIVVTLILVGVLLAGVYTFMGDVFSEAQVNSVKTNFTGVQTTVDEMINTSKDIQTSTEHIEPTISNSGFLGTTINALIISAKAVTNSIDSIGNLITSIFRVFGISTSGSSMIFGGLVAVFTVIIVFTALRGTKGDV